MRRRPAKPGQQTAVDCQGLSAHRRMAEGQREAAGYCRRGDPTTGLLQPAHMLAERKGAGTCCSALRCRACKNVGNWQTRSLPAPCCAFGEAKFDEAWQDLLACHRLGRLVARGATLIEGLFGIAIDQTASQADLAYIERANLTSKQVLDRLKDLQNLPPMPPLADKIDIGERHRIPRLAAVGYTRLGQRVGQEAERGGTEGAGKDRLGARAAQRQPLV